MQIGQVNVEQEGVAGAELAKRTRLESYWSEGEEGQAVPSSGSEHAETSLVKIGTASYAGGGRSKT